MDAKTNEKRTNKQNNLSDKQLIILNQMFAGSYITDGNLGHEVINLIPADKSDKEGYQFYIWLNANGRCPKYHELDKNSKVSVDNCTIVFVRCINKELYKVLGYAKKCKLLAEACEPINSEERFNLQKDLKVTYGGVPPINDEGKPQLFPEKDLFATFKAKEVYITNPNTDVYLTGNSNLKNNENIYYLDKFNGISECMRRYIEVESRETEINKLLSDEEIWKQLSKDNKEIINEYKELPKPEFNFFKLIKKDKDELSISNALVYYIEKIEKNKFLEKCLGLEVAKDFLGDDYELKREQDNVDILFLGKEHVVIIENKIDADITKDGKTYEKQIENALKNFDFNENDKETIKKLLKNKCESEDNKGKVATQLSKYYIYAIIYLCNKKIENKETIDITKIEENIKCYLLLPNYSLKIFSKSENKCYISNNLFSEKYKIITYERVFNFFDENVVEDNYFKDFLSVLKPLKSDFNNDIENETKKLFYKKIIEERKNLIKSRKGLKKSI